jgi:hypothetical protein
MPRERRQRDVVPQRRPGFSRSESAHTCWPAETSRIGDDCDTWFAAGERLDDYGYGVWSYDTRIGGRMYRAVKRPGRIMGAQGQLYRLLEPDVTVVILSNTGTTDLDVFVAEIGRKIVGGM